MHARDTHDEDRAAQVFERRLLFLQQLLSSSLGGLGVLQCDGRLAAWLGAGGGRLAARSDAWDGVRRRALNFSFLPRLRRSALAKLALEKSLRPMTPCALMKGRNLRSFRRLRAAMCGQIRRAKAARGS